MGCGSQRTERHRNAGGVRIRSTATSPDSLPPVT